MSAYRVNYTPEPEEATPRQRHTWGGIFGAIALMAVLAAFTIATSRGESVGPVATALPRAEVAGFDLEPLDGLDGQRLADIRVEAFRAGYQNAVDDGCRSPALITPIADRQP